MMVVMRANDHVVHHGGKYSAGAGVLLVKGGIVEDAEGVFGGSMGAAPTLFGPAISP